MCVPQQQVVGQTFVTVDPWVKPGVLWSAAPIFMFAVVPGRPKACNVSTLGRSPDLIHLSCNKHVYARSSNWPAEPL